MVDAGVGRLLVASLHQGIADVAPMRLEFYEDWLTPKGMRDGRIGLAPLGAVLSFLQREPSPDNERIPVRAGICAAEWAFAAASAPRRLMLRRLPLRFRSRAAIGFGRAFIHDTITPATVRTRHRRGEWTVEIRSPIFTYLRDQSAEPMRRYYVAAFERLLTLASVDAAVAVEADEVPCRLRVRMNGARPHTPADLERA
jgi:hypothetical protein